MIIVGIQKTKTRKVTPILKNKNKKNVENDGRTKNRNTNDVDRRKVRFVLPSSSNSSSKCPRTYDDSTSNKKYRSYGIEKSNDDTRVRTYRDALVGS